MATLATFFRRQDFMGAESTMEQQIADPYRLRSLPADSIYFYSKRIDNSRLVREADPKTRSACWSTIATACVLAVMIVTAASPRIGSVMAGYTIERLKAEQAELTDKYRLVQIEEAKMLSPARLEELASKGNLAAPAPGQEQHLQPKDSSFALNVKASMVSSQ